MSGVPVVDTAGKWNRTANTASFDDGASDTVPAAVSGYFPTADIAGIAGETGTGLSYYVQFITAAGTAITLDGNQLSPVLGPPYSPMPN